MIRHEQTESISNERLIQLLVALYLASLPHNLLGTRLINMLDQLWDVGKEVHFALADYVDDIEAVVGEDVVDRLGLRDGQMKLGDPTVIEQRIADLRGKGLTLNEAVETNALDFPMEA